MGDPPVDDLIARLSDAEEQKVSNLFRQLVATDGPLPAALPDPVEKYFRDTEAWPAWTDHDQIRRGERVFSKYGPELIAGLFCAALPQCYANHAGVVVLTMTGRMQGSGLERRIMETAQFVCVIVDEGGMDQRGHGIRTIQKVRLMHGGIRELIRQGRGKYDYDEKVRGTPICQEDLAFTLMSFSVVLLDVVESLGVTLSTADREAWVHLWRNVGHFIGIQDDANPRDYADAQAFSKVYRQRNFGPSQEGRELTRALLGVMKRAVPGRIADSFPAAFIRCMNDDGLADMLGVEPATVARGIVKAETRFVRLLDRVVPGGLGILPFVGMWFDELLRGIAIASRGGKTAGFRIPQHLKSRRRTGAWRQKGRAR